MSAFHAGQKVVCVGWPWRGFSLWLQERLHPFNSPKVGDVLTVSNVIHGEDEDDLLIELLEFPSPSDAHWCAGFLARGFRPVIERKTDISVFTEMLTKETTHA